MTNKKLSVIVPIYNADKYLKKCLDSICFQTYQNLQIILINDGSADSSLSICNEYKKRDQRIEIYTQENSGVSSARNVGLIKAKGDYITFVDSDDYLEHNAYEMALKENIDCDAIFFSYREEYPEKNHKRAYFQSKNGIATSEEAIYQCIKPLGYEVVVWNKIIKKEIAKSELFDKKYGIAEDWLWIVKVLKKCNSVYMINKQLYNYVQTELSAWRSKVIIDKKWKRVFDLQDELLLELKDDNKNYNMASARFYNDYHQLIWRSYIMDDLKNTKQYANRLSRFKEPFYRCKEYSTKKKIKYFVINLLIKIRAPKNLIFKITKLTSYKTKIFLFEGKRI